MATLKPESLDISQSLTAFLKDVGNQFQVSVSNQRRNERYLLKRLAHEGIGFVTKTLPKLGKAIDASLRDGRIHPVPVKTSRRGSLPLCLTGLINLVFDADGTLREYPSHEAIRYIRQLCYMYYKLDGGYPKELVDECIETFVAVDEELVHCDTVSPEIAGVLHHAAEVIETVFQDFDSEDITPRPGPGVTADKCACWHRYAPHVHYKVLHEAYPYYRYFYNSVLHLTDSVHSYRQLPRHQDGCSVLAVVPKDSRGPRIICMEPSEYMWLQQGLGRAIVKHLQSHPLTRGHVNFDDQTINGSIAKKASMEGRHATLDMKEASDRISKSLIDVLFDGVPVLKRKLLALSTNRTRLPSGVILATRKYAPMGSALCFPVMSIVHYALALGSLKVRKPGCTYKALAEDLYVYGDDIICHVRDVESLMEDFPLYGLKFNRDKSFFHGKFRESCGVDAYDGTDVTPVRVKSTRLLYNSGVALQRSLAYYHSLKDRGYTNLAQLWRNLIDRVYGDLPYVTAESGIPGWIVPRSRVYRDNARWKWDRKWQTWVKRVRVVQTPQHASMIGHWERLLRTQVHCQEEESSPLYRRSHTKIVWKRIPISSL